MLYLHNMNKNLSKYIFLLGVILTFGCSKFEKIRNSDDVDKKLTAAYKYFDEEEYYKAQVLFDETLPLLKGKESAEKATYYRALSYYNQKQYILSAYYFKDYYDTYTRSERAEEALYMAAKSLYNDTPRYNLDQSNALDALRAFQKYANRYPNSDRLTEVNKLTDEINKKLEKKAFEKAKLYYELGHNNTVNFKSAVIALETFRKQFPSSSFIEEAAWFKIDAQYKLALGSVITKQEERYLEAINFYENFVDEFPSSKYLKEAEGVYKKCLSNIEKIRS
jgi:outer membrane protein assembly factor BamD